MVTFHLPTPNQGLGPASDGLWGLAQILAKGWVGVRRRSCGSCRCRAVAVGVTVTVAVGVAVAVTVAVAVGVAVAVAVAVGV